MVDAMAVLRDAVAWASGLDRSGWSGIARSEALVELVEARDRLDAVIVGVTAEWDRERSWELDGARSPVAWLAQRVPATRQEASTSVRTARHVAAFDQTAKALDAGDISVSHVTVAAQAAKHRHELYREHEDVILDAARSLPASAFRPVMEYWRACADDVAAEGPTADDANYLDIAATFVGVGHVDGRLDPIATKALTDRLDALEPPDPTDGSRPPRTLGQRRAAALLRLVCGDRSPTVNIDVIVDVDTLAGRALTDPVKGCCEIVRSGPISSVLGRTLACDAAIGRVLMRGDSEILDLGRRTRLITPALRRMLAVRDRTCVEPGCDIPAHWCDGHHIVPWERHGPTSLDNLELRCRRHHVAAHRRLHDEPRRRPQRE